MNRVFIALLVTMVFGSAALAEELNKIAVVDMGRVGRETPYIQEALTKVSAAEQSLMRLMQTAETELKTLQSKKGSTEEEFKKKQSEIQTLVDKRVSEIEALKSGFDLKIKNDVKAVVDQLVKEKSLELILDKAFVAAAGLDVTDEFIAKLQSSETAKASK